MAIKEDGRQVVDLARQLGFISDQQARQLLDELDMFPGNNVVNLMLKRHLITPEQLLEVQGAAGGGEGAPAGARPAAAPPPPPSAPANHSSPYAAHRPQPAPGSGGAHQRPAGNGSEQARSSSAAGFDPGQVRSPYAPPLPQRPSAPHNGGGTAPSPSPPAVGMRPPGSAHSSSGQASRPSASAGPQQVALASPGGPIIQPLPPTAGLKDYLVAARQAGCSDLHLCVNRPPFVRRFGEIHYLDEPDLTPQRAERLNFSALSPGLRAQIAEHLQTDFSFDIPGVGRHRCNVFKSRVGWEGSYRLIPETVPTLEQLGMPPVLKTLTEYHQGLILVTGAGGSGKTTTVAAMLDHISRNRTDHIITVEDPVEYVFQPTIAQITQREVGRHTQSFANALRGALRQDPDVIMVGEMRDLETTSIAISAAETGHLVFGTLHTNTAARTVARIMDIYPSEQRTQICVMVAESLRGIVTQQLVPRKDIQGLVPAMEILVFHPGVAMAIKEGKTYQLISLMQSGKRMGMKIMDESLMELYQEGLISGRQAFLRAENKLPFEAMKDQD